MNKTQRSELRVNLNQGYSICKLLLLKTLSQ